MGNSHRKTTLDRARDEIMSHVVRCNVLDSRMSDRHEWLDETLEYMRDRYPMLSAMEFAKLEMIGRQFIEPAIPHGKGMSARNRPEPTVMTTEGEEITEAEAAEIATEAPVMQTA